MKSNLKDYFSDLNDSSKQRYLSFKKLRITEMNNKILEYKNLNL